MSQFDTETVAPDQRSGAHSALIGVVLVFTEGVGPLRRALDLRDPAVTGRGDVATFVLDDRKASRAHARLEAGARGVFVEDLGSRNGVFVNGERITERTYAPEGAVLRVGNSLMLVDPDVSRFATASSDVEGDFVGGPSLEEVRDMVGRAARGKAPLLVLGENGVGKELVAAAVHRQSGRPGDLVAVNCAAIPGELMEAELFGHGRGAFSGADKPRLGLIRAADGGTLFLDEIGEMPLAAQAKLLRVLETGEVRPVGRDESIHVDLRVVSATNVDLLERAQTGAFREDLYHRIAALVARVPPLRERREDLPHLFAHFADDDVQISADAMQQLLLWPWSGNVRELRNVVGHAQSVLGEDRVVRILGLPEPMRDVRPPVASPERDLYVTALEAAGGNVAAAARELGMRRATLYEQLRRLEIDPAAYRR